ncbi:hypothetical protein CRP01_37545 [Flavilitoribacter nigricans DSM 23189 = NBRC 102662]|uniref:Uncharacterized protein n=1 Tax=Flavilitoribacter nigricans (strain ATCC 23147 / DSM 23189 / NBRC 102662 / NCIMB 1420 / SS-2) TaxID=1122177 RepID=A0A2D0N0Y1_FLAN2|nr:hypothetical protein CRP01_37545 [Flavilitoribacter nigricans DSM 23189 = NBRC 102662]
MLLAFWACQQVTDDGLPSVPCEVVPSDTLLAGRLSENVCGTLQELLLEVPNPDRGDSTKLNLDINLDGVADFEFMATLSYSPSHYRPGLFLRALHDRAFFGLFQREYSMCHLLYGPYEGKVLEDCRENCSDFSPEDLAVDHDTVFYAGRVRYVEGLEAESVIDDHLLWEQFRTPFTKPKPNPGAKDCLEEVAGLQDKWTREKILYIPIKLVDDQGVPLLGWVRCQHDGSRNPVFESYLQVR